MNEHWLETGGCSNEPVKLQRFDRWHGMVLQLFYGCISRGEIFYLYCIFFFYLHTLTSLVYHFVFAGLATKWWMAPLYIFFIFFIYTYTTILYSSLFNIIIQLHSYLCTFFRLSRSLDSAYLVILARVFKPSVRSSSRHCSQALIATPLKPLEYKLFYHLIRILTRFSLKNAFMACFVFILLFYFIWIDNELLGHLNG